MKPVSLTLSAFGPFGATVHLSFEELFRHSLFLISGATGAGKTTLLDAMCFALYGVTSGQERSVREMRSHHASPATRTEVTFCFTVKGKRYRVRRAPEQERPRTRGGGGVSTLKSQVSLEIRSRDVAEDEAEDAPGRSGGQATLGLGGEEAWTTLGTKAADVDERIQQLIGLSAEQFCQVVLLPQGRFREFLLASSRERQAILETLFGTERYRQIEEALREEAQRLKGQIEGERGKRSLLLEQVGLGAGHELEAELARVAAQRDEQARLIEERARALAEARAALDRGRVVAERVAERKAAAAALAEVDADTPAHDERRRRLAIAREATVVWTADQLWRAAEGERADGERRLREGEQALGEARRAREEAARRLDVEQARASSRDEVYERYRTLQGWQERLAGFRAAAVRVDEQATETARRRAEHGAALARRELLQGELLKASEARDEARLLASQVESRRAAYVRLLQVRKTWLRHQEVLARQAVNDERFARAIDASGRLKRELAAAEAARDAAESSWMRGRAAELAHTLVDGSPCPVCGSTEHPAPAGQDRRGAEEVSLQRVRERRADVDRVRAELDEVGRQQAAAEAERVGLAKEAALIAEQLEERAELGHTARGLATSRSGPGAAPGAELDHDAFEAEVDRAAEAVEAAEAAWDSLDGLKQQVALLTEDEGVAATAALAAEQAALAAEGELQQARAVLEERKGGLPADLVEEGALERALADAQGQLDRLDLARREAEERFQAAERALAVAEEAFRLGKEEQAGRERACAERRAAFEAALVETGLVEEAWREARLSPDEQAAVQAAVDAFAERRAGALDRLQRAQAALEGASEVDVEALVADERRAASEHAEAVLRLGELTARGQQLARVGEGLSDAEEHAEALEERYRVVGRVAEVALGSNGQRITFQRFVLATLLDEVLQTASQRLLEMSRGRYLIRRAQGPTGSRRRAQGLELVVLDHHTGTERNVSTLSGGESFLAALSLALGLADAVQARAGGRPLEAIFIDEGFGGLDPEALDLALAALTRLKDSGRLVGIISHVAELKERMEARLEVEPGRRGSRVRMRTGAP